MYLTPINSRCIYRALFAILTGVDDSELEQMYPEIDLGEFYALFVKNEYIGLFSACNKMRRLVIESKSVEEIAGLLCDFRQLFVGRDEFLVHLNYLVRKENNLPYVKDDVLFAVTYVMQELSRRLYGVFPDTVDFSAINYIFCSYLKRKNQKACRLVEVDKYFPGGFYASGLKVFDEIKSDEDLLRFMQRMSEKGKEVSLVRQCLLFKPKYRNVHFIVDGENFIAGDVDSFFETQVVVRDNVNVDITVYVDASTKIFWDYFAEKCKYDVKIEVVPRLLKGKSRVDTAISMGATSMYSKYPNDFIFVMSSDSDMSSITSFIPNTNLGFVFTSRNTSPVWLRQAKRHRYIYCFCDCSLSGYNRALFLMNFLKDVYSSKFGDKQPSTEQWKDFIVELGLSDFTRWTTITRLRIVEGKSLIPVFK